MGDADRTAGRQAQIGGGERNGTDFLHRPEDQRVNGDYADLLSDGGREHSITMFLLPEGTTVGSRLKLENFQWELLEM